MVRLAPPPLPSGTRSPAAWHSLEPQAALERLGSSPEGLTEDEAHRRREQYGPNELPRARADSALKVLWRQIDNPLIWVLLGAGALALALGKGADGAVVLAVVVLNTLIGFLQEIKAGQAIEALSRMVPEQATVVREGQRQSLPAHELVPGDVVHLAAGDRVPADVRLLAARGLQVEEAALTGESVPVRKGVAPTPAQVPLGDRSSLAFGGTVVTSGTGTGVVVATASNTELGRISDLLQQTVELETPLTRALGRIGRLITAGVLAVAAVLLAVALLRGYPPGDSLLVAITLAVAAVPEGLPAVVTIALAIGVQRMARRNAIIRLLPAVETLGSTTTICTDKTGTLTRNEMTVQALWVPSGQYGLSGVGYAPQGQLLRQGRPLEAVPEEVHALLLASALCSDASLQHEEGQWRVAGDPTEGALVVAAEKVGVRVEQARAQRRRVDGLPFESEQQYMATVHDVPELGHQLLLKGAPEAVLPRCEPRGGLSQEAVHAEVEHLASLGMRVLAVAARQRQAHAGLLSHEEVADGGFRLLGLVGMIDPPRPEALEAVRVCQAAGITIKMITGDHRLTAEAIGAQLGLGRGGRALTGQELEAASDEELREMSARTDVFARVAPEHKLRLVRALQARNHVVAMTGDGVNDAPALRQANIGVAMGITGTAVSREAADLVLADDNFASIAAAVEEGRRVYDNLIKALAFVLPTNLGLALILTAAVLAFPLQVLDGQQVPLLPMRPSQILWINLVSAVALSLPLAFEVAERNVMRRPPRDPQAPVLSGFLLVRTALVALLMAAGAVGMFLWEYRSEVGEVGHSFALAEAQTMAVTTVVLFQAFYLFNCRSLRGSAWELGLFRNRTIFLGVGALAVLHLGFIYLPPMQRLFGTAPLSLEALGLSALMGSIILPVIALEKALRTRSARRREQGARAQVGA